MSIAEEYARVARSYLGTPFHHQGRLPGVGLDCAGVVVCAAREVGLTIEDVFGYARVPSDGTLRTAVAKHAMRVDPEDIRTGDTLLFTFRTEPHHLAVFSDGVMIHAYSPVRKVVENRIDATWRGRLCGVYRIREGGV